MLSFLYTFLIFVLFSNFEANAFRYDYTYYQESDVWIKLHLETRNWHDARKMCDMEGATLASPVDPAITNAIADLAHKFGVEYVYVGVHATFSDGVWHTIEGIPLPRLQDNVSIKNLGSSDEKCAVSMFTTLHSVKCTNQYSFVCYKRDSQVPDVTSCGTIDRDYDLHKSTGSCYKFHKAGLSWAKAYETCSAEGAYLTIINSDTENSLVKEIFERKKHTITLTHDPGFLGVGFVDWERNGEWYTVDGKRLEDSGFMKWLQGEPSHKGNNEFCGSFHINGGLNDIGCHVKIPFLCEKDVDSLNVKNNTVFNHKFLTYKK